MTLARNIEPIENKFRKCYAAAVFVKDPALRRFTDRLAADNIVLIEQIIAHKKNDFFKKYKPTERTKKALVAGLKEMGLQFAG